MAYSLWGAVATGLTAGTVLALVAYGCLVLLRLKLDPFFFLGTIAPFRRGLALYPAGLLAFLLASIVFALVYAALFEAIGIQRGEREWGLLFGVLHWVVDGTLLGVASRRHPGILRGRVADPGAFALSLPTASAIAFLGAHLVYGVLAVNFYAALR